MMHILAVHAHPDDVEYLCAGTLAMLAAKGHRITIATMTAGDCGSRDFDQAQIAKMRKDEATHSAARIGARYHCAGFGDLALFNDDASRRRTTEMLRLLKPDLVIAPSPQDYHPDHEAASALVRDACFAAPIPNYKTGSGAVLGSIPHLYFMDPIEGRDRTGNKVVPNFGIDITQYFECKRDMLAAHTSQRSWVLNQHGIDNYIGAMERWSEKRGRLFGVRYAEGFRQYTGTPYPRTPLLQDIAAQACLNLPPQEGVPR